MRQRRPITVNTLSLRIGGTITPMQTHANIGGLCSAKPSRWYHSSFGPIFLLSRKFHSILLRCLRSGQRQTRCVALFVVAIEANFDAFLQYHCSFSWILQRYSSYISPHCTGRFRKKIFDHISLGLVLEYTAGVWGSWHGKSVLLVGQTNQPNNWIAELWPSWKRLCNFPFCNPKTNRRQTNKHVKFFENFMQSYTTRWGHIFSVSQVYLDGSILPLDISWNYNKNTWSFVDKCFWFYWLYSLPWQQIFCLNL